MADKIAISLESELLQKIESLRKKTGESRSAVFARAARVLLGEEDKRRALDEYVEGYRRQLESDEDVALAEALATASLAGVEWDE